MHLHWDPIAGFLAAPLWLQIVVALIFALVLYVWVRIIWPQD